MTQDPTPPTQAPTSPDSFASLRERHGPRYRWLLLASLMVGIMASIMSSTIVNVAIPDLSRHFALGQERAQWVTSGFMVAMTVSMLTTPWLLARYGYRRTYVGCMLLLLAGGVAGGLAAHYPLVLAARIAEGVAAGVVQPIPTIVILRAFESREQGRATGLFGMGVVLAPAVGPSIGGLLVDGFGWRSIFFMVVPFCLASIWLARRYVPDAAPGGAQRSGAALDWIGLTLGGVGTLCLLNGLVELYGGTPWLAAVLLASALGVFGAFVAWQRRVKAGGRQPLMDLDLFADRTYAMGAIVSFIYGIALFGSTYLLPVYMQLGLGLQAAYAGTILLPPSLALAFTMAGAGRLINHYSTAAMVTFGLALLAASFVLTATIGLTTTLWVLVAWTVLGRIGLGFVLPSLSLGSLRSLDRALVPQGSSTISFVRMLGGAAGVSLCAVVLEWRAAAHGDTLTHAVTSAARLAAFAETFVFLALVCGAAIGAAWRMRDVPATPQQPPASQ